MVILGTDIKAACGESHARAVFISAHTNGRAVSSLYEERDGLPDHNAGALSVPRAHSAPTSHLTRSWVGLNNTANPATQLCSLEDICAFGGFHNETPDQWFRYVMVI